ncbi:MAG: hypothetical protein WKF57_04145 [Nakamurella sp.]
MLPRRNDGTFIVNPIPLIGDRAVVGLGCWSAGDLPVTRERVDLVLAGSPSVTISAPVELVTILDVRGSFN